MSTYLRRFNYEKSLGANLGSFIPEKDLSALRWVMERKLTLYILSYQVYFLASLNLRGSRGPGDPNAEDAISVARAAMLQCKSRWYSLSVWKPHSLKDHVPDRLLAKP